MMIVYLPPTAVAVLTHVEISRKGSGPGIWGVHARGVGSEELRFWDQAWAMILNKVPSLPGPSFLICEPRILGPALRSED